MKHFKAFLKDLKEEKIIAKEDGEGASGGGEVSAPSDSGSSSNSGDVVQGGEMHGMTTDDVLGKHCDHQKDGFFGPGCFHRPFAIWSVPAPRLMKKPKKKHLKILNLAEDETFGKFQEFIKPIIENEFKSAQDYCNNIDDDIIVKYEPDYEFSEENHNEDWVAAYDKENQSDAKEFNIGINLPVLYNFLDENEMAFDKKECELQIKVAVFHELAHALLQYFQDQEIFDFELTEMEQEKVAEEFAKYQIKRYSEVFNSKLNDFINNIFIQDQKQQQK